MSDPNDAFEAAYKIVLEASDKGLPVKLIGGQAVRILCPSFPPRARAGQDMDFASISSAKSTVMEFFSDQGFVGDKKFNTLHGDRQMYFTTPDGVTAVDVIMDKLNMCHILEFKDRINRMPYTLDVTDLLLTKLQVVEQNEKDAQDIIYLLAGFEIHDGDEPGTLALSRLTKVLGEDWGWWRTSTGNLDRIVELAGGDLKRLVPPDAPYDPVSQARRLREHADTMPKSLRWKLRARVGERVQWYELPEEVGH